MGPMGPRGLGPIFFLTYICLIHLLFVYFVYLFNICLIVLPIELPIELPVVLPIVLPIVFSGLVLPRKCFRESARPWHVLAWTCGSSVLPTFVRVVLPRKSAGCASENDTMAE